MKNNLKLIPIIALLAVNACSFANKSTVTVPINSNTPGANVMIDGKNFGQTPAFVELNPGKNHQATISKEGYTPATINMDTYYSVRGGDGADGGRCMADFSAAAIPYFIVLLFAPEKCASFKQSSYFADLQMIQSSNNQMDGAELPQNNQQPQYQNNNYKNYYPQ